MSNVDERIVSMKFDNAQFEAASKTTLGTLDQLNKSLRLENATKGITDVNNAAKKTDFSSLLHSVQSIEDKFQAMSVVAISALATIASRATQAGLSIAKSLTIDPIKSGFQEYETNISSIQTILANTQAASVTLGQVTDALQELNLYADLTIYNFSEMARNIGTFTAAGVSLKPAVAAIKGIANLAALSGSNSQQAATAMYQLSQAISAGKVQLIDWNSVVNAGMGGTVFQRALAQTAVVMGKLSASSVTLSGDMKTVKINGDAFRESLEKGWLTADVLTNTLSQFTGDLKDAELAAMGFNATQIKAIQDQAAVARAAATEVKTMSQLLGALREGAGSGWATTWQIIFGNFTEAKELWTGAYKTLDGIIGASSKARNELLSEWKELGGRQNLFAGIANVFKTFTGVLKPIRAAFSEIFPPITAQRLAAFTKAWADFTAKLIPSGKVIETIHEVSLALFSVFGLITDILGRVIGLFFDLGGSVTEGSDGFLDFIITIARFIHQVIAAIRAGESLDQVFGGIGRVLQLPIQAIQALSKVLGKLVSGFDTEKAADGIADFIGNLSLLSRMTDIVGTAWGHLFDVMKAVWNFFVPLGNKMAEFFKSTSDALGGFNFSDILSAINTGLFAALVYSIVTNVGKVSGVVDSFTKTLSSMQSALNAAALLQIAIAIGVIAAAAVVLSTLDAGQLTKSLAAIGVMFTELVATMTLMSAIGVIKVGKMYVLAASFTVLGVAINLLAIAVRQLAILKPEELHRGLISVALMLGTLVVVTRTLPSGAELIGVSTSLVILSTAILIMVQSIKQLSGLNWEELARGLSGIAILLGSLALFSRFASTNATGILAGVGIVLLAAAIKILASAIVDLQSVSWENIGKGLATITGSLGLITGALLLLSAAAPTAPLSAAAIFVVALSIKILANAISSMAGISWENFAKGMAIVAGALTLISAALLLVSDVAPTAILSAAAIYVVSLALDRIGEAIASMGSMGWEQIVKGLTTLAGALLIIVAAMIAMQAGLLGAAALLVVSGALLVLSSVLRVLGGMEWSEIFKGLIALAAVFAIVGAAGVLLTAAIPGMLGLGAALLLIGAGLALAGAGVFLFAAGLTALSVAGAAGAAAVVAILSAVISLIPTLVKQVGTALLLLIDILFEGIPKIVGLILELLVQLIDGLDKILPKFGVLILKLILLILKILEEAVPRLYNAGLNILLGVLRAIQDHIGLIVDVAGDIVIRFLQAIGRKLPQIADAGFKMLISFMDGITRAIRANSDEMGRAGADMAWAIVEGVIRGLNSFGERIRSKLLDLARGAWRAALDFLGISSPSKKAIWMGEMFGKGTVIGLESSAKIIKEAASGIGETAVDSLRKSLGDISRLIAKDIDPNPTITPVLDLTAVQQKSAELWSLMNIKPITVEGSYSSARQAEAALENNRSTTFADENDRRGDIVNFNQYNTSPKALTTAEIYRNTKNQLSTARGVLPT